MKIICIEAKKVIGTSVAETELSVFVKGNNILAFERNSKLLTARWDLDDLVLWLKGFIVKLEEDPYPVDVEGEYAAEKELKAHEFDSENDEEFDIYYDRLYEWNLRHRWHPASAGAILADVCFQLIGDSIEVSWNNTDTEEGVTFKNILGGVRVNSELFVSAVDSFIGAYTRHWENTPTDKTFVILIGFIVGITDKKADVSPNTALFWKTGVCGGFTTFSTFSLEAFMLFEIKAYALGGAYVTLSVCCCIFGIFLGKKLASLYI